MAYSTSAYCMGSKTILKKFVDQYAEVDYTTSAVCKIFIKQFVSVTLIFCKLYISILIR